MAEVKHLNNENFEAEVLKADGITLVDFWATWCGPCQMLAPVIEEIAAENEGFSVAKVDIDQCLDLAMQYKVVSIPTLLVFKGGEVVAKSIGVITKEEILELVAGI